MPVPYLQEKPLYPFSTAKPSSEVPDVLVALLNVFNPQVATLPVDSTSLTLREAGDGSTKRLEAVYGHNVLCLTYKFNTDAEALEILDLNEGAGQRTTLDADGSYGLSVGGMGRTRYGTEFQGEEQVKKVGPEKAAVELAKFRQVIEVAEQHIR